MKTSASIQASIDAVLAGCITVQDLCKRYKISQMTALNWRRRGCPAVVIPGYERTSTVRYVPSEVKQWLKTNGHR